MAQNTISTNIQNMGSIELFHNLILIQYANLIHSHTKLNKNKSQNNFLPIPNSNLGYIQVLQIYISMIKDGEEKGEEPKWEKRRKGGPNWVFPNKKARERERLGWSRVWVEREDRCVRE